VRKSRAGNTKHNARNAEWNRNNREHVNAKRRETYALKRATDPAALSAKKRAEKLKVLYGLTVEQYDDMREAQGFKCAICGADTKLYVDHCHTSEEVRGLLCHQCNVALGLFKDNTASLARAIEYLECKRH
jgi:hypothetical protein